MTETNKNKRQRSEDDGAIISKRHKPAVSVESPSLLSSKPVTPQFQRFHLNILQSLYDSDNEEDEEDAGDVVQEGHSQKVLASANQANSGGGSVNDKLWAKTKKFLREREQLILRKKEAARLKDVHQEALHFMDERDQGSPGQSPPPLTAWQSVSKDKGSMKGRSINPLVAQSAGYQVPLCASSSPAHSLSFFSPTQQPAPSQQASVANNNSDSNHNKSPMPVKCFGLVATLLEKRFHSFESSVRRSSDPYGPVLKEIEANIINKLEGKLQRLQDHSVAHQKQTVEDLLSRPVLVSSLASSSALDTPRGSSYGSMGGKGDMNSSLSKLETKLRLWNMLAADMRNIVVAK